MLLSQVLKNNEVARDGEFSRLGYVDSHCAGLLAYADSMKYVHMAKRNPKLTCLITTPDLAKTADFVNGLVVVQNPRYVFYNIHQYFLNNSLYKYPFEPYLGSNCKIHKSAVIASGSHIGDNVIISEHVVIREPLWIGSNVTIEPGVKLGVEGILYNKINNNNYLIPHGGYVRIENDVVLMTNSIVVRSIHDTDSTEIGRGSIIGLGTVVGHEAKVGKNVIISNQCVLARRSIIGNNAFIGTQVMIKESVNIGQNSRIMAGSIVIDDVLQNKTVSGNFATNHKNRMIEYIRKLKKN